MKVRAKMLGEYPLNEWKQPGAVFTVTEEKFSPYWMEKLEDDRPVIAPEQKQDEDEQAPPAPKAKPKAKSKTAKG